MFESAVKICMGGNISYSNGFINSLLGKGQERFFFIVFVFLNCTNEIYS